MLNPHEETTLEIQPYINSRNEHSNWKWNLKQKTKMELLREQYHAREQ